MVQIEKANPSLKGVLPRDYARPALDKEKLGELIDLIGTMASVAVSSAVAVRIAAEMYVEGETAQRNTRQR